MKSNEETSEPSDQMTLQSARKRLTAFQVLRKSQGWDLLVDDGEMALAHKLQSALQPVENIDGLLRLLSTLGQMKGIQEFSALLEGGIESAEYDILQYTPKEDEDESDSDE
jgi:hypothetical protein